MPLYEYECSKHGRFEVLMSIKHYDEVPILPCPFDEHCHKECKRVMSKNSFRLKGIGWSADGYENKPPYEP